MQIQYEGFIVVGASRIYQFSVTGALAGPGQYSVGVSLESFHSTPLRFQDGPPISFQRLKQELDQETEALHSDLRLDIGGNDIQEYLERQYPRKRASERASRKTPSPSLSSNPRLIS